MSTTAESLRMAQDSISPTIYVGLGGTGSRIVDNIAEKAKQLPDWEERRSPLTTFISIDTNEGDLKNLSNISRANQINISSFDKRAAIEGYRRGNNEQAGWLNPGYNARSGNKPGAGQIRVESRLGFFYNSPQIKQQLQNVIANALKPNITWRQATPPRFNVYLVCSLAGGTGSGSFLPAAYLLDAVIREKNWEPRIISHLLLSTLLQNVVGTELHRDIHANTYAALKELEYLTKLGYSEVHRRGRHEEIFSYEFDRSKTEAARVSKPPFFFNFIYDRPAHISLSNPELSIADAIYVQTQSPIMEHFAGELDNYEKNMERLARFPSAIKDVTHGYAKNYGSCGIGVISFPGHGFLEYSANRFSAEAIRKQITFGADQSQSDDAINRVLARFAVDYSDPKFVNMSDADKRQRINQSFQDSVRELARQEVRNDNEAGFWNRLVENVDEGLPAGTSDDGEITRHESLIKRVTRLLDDRVKAIANKITVQSRAFTFQKDSYNQYIDLVNNARSDIQKNWGVIRDEAAHLSEVIGSGELIDDLELAPLEERYLVVTLVHICNSEWIPETTTRLDRLQQAALENERHKDKLDKENIITLREESQKRKFFSRNDDEFFNTRNVLEQELREHIEASRLNMSTFVRDAALRALLDDCKNRSRKFADIAIRMNGLVSNIEKQALQLLNREKQTTPPYALGIEALETMSEPRRRLWAEAYDELFIANGRYLATFDRDELARLISNELKSKVDELGRIQEKSLDEIVKDIHETVMEYGRARLSPSILGDQGLDLAAALRLEAELSLDNEHGQDDIDSYIASKLRGVEQHAGVLARMDLDSYATYRDEVEPNRSRLLMVGPSRSAQRASTDFENKAMDIIPNAKSSLLRWYDPQTLVVHDVNAVLPLFYFQGILGEVEDAYLDIARDDGRGYDLHIDFSWEKSLPNLNPRQSEITVTWALELLRRGLLTKVIEFDSQKSSWVHRNASQEGDDELGLDLSNTLYEIGSYYEENRKTSKQNLEEHIAERESPETQEENETELQAWLKEELLAIERRAGKGEETNLDVLDGPVLRALTTMI